MAITTSATAVSSCATASMPSALGSITPATARLLGEADRGRIGPGAHADIVLLDDTGRLVETIIAGRSANSG